MQTKITHRIAESLSKSLNSKISVGKVDIGFFNKLHLEDVLIEDRNNDTLLYSKLITARIDTLRIKKKQISINQLSFENNKITVSRDSCGSFNFRFLMDALKTKPDKDTLSNWVIKCNDFNFGKLNISYNDVKNDQDLFISDLNLDISDFRSRSDSTSFIINHLSLTGEKNLNLEYFNARVAIHENNIGFEDFNLKSSYSEIDRSNLQIQLYNELDSMNVPFDFNMHIGQSHINFQELGELIPSIKGMNQQIELSGLIYGNLSDLKGKNVVLKTGEETRALLDFYINDLKSPETMYLFLDLKQSETTFADISNIRLPNRSKRSYLEFPESFYEAGQLKYRGNFSGFLSDFVTFGTFESEMGILTTDIMVAPEKDGEVYYRGQIATTDFNLGHLFQTDYVKNITFKGSADGNYNKATQSVSGIFKGNIDEVEVNNYKYENLTFDGILIDKMFDGLLAINDKNLQFSFLGEVNLNQEIPEFDFKLQLDRALLKNLNLGDKFPNATVALKMNANFTGTKIENLNGSIKLEEGFYRNRNGEIDLTNVELKSTSSEKGNSLLFTSQYFDATLEGKYNIKGITDDIQKIIHHYIPSTKYTANENIPNNVFSYQLNVKEINGLSKIFIPGLEFESSFLLYGLLDTPNNNFKFKGSIPGIRYKNTWARDIFISNQDIETHFSSKLRVGEIFNKSGLKLYNFSITSEAADNIIDNHISWSNFDDQTYSGLIKLQTKVSWPDSINHPHFDVDGLASGIYIADTLWSISPFSATVDSNAVAVNNFIITHGDQLFALDGKINGGVSNLLNLKFENINLGYLDEYLDKELEVEGVVNGQMAISNIFNDPVLLSNVSINNLSYKNQFMGDISLISHWDRINSSINSELTVTRNNKQNLRALGYIKPSTKEINYDVSVDSLSLIILETFMRKNFSNFQGMASGQATISGTLDKIRIDGAILGENAGLTVDVTQIPYNFSDTVYFKNDTILFDNITFYDDRNNSGKFNGTIVHDNFNNMVFDLHFNSNKLRALNTTLRDNDQFYGTAIVNGGLDITGGIRQILLKGTATTLSGTEVKISMESESEIERYDFIKFVTADKEEENDYFTPTENSGESEVNMSFTVEATPEAKVEIIYNSKIGDIIKAQGEGILLFEMDNEGKISLSGNYNVTRGDYLFTLQNVMNKRFTIEQGGSIIWSGDPYNAYIDLRAIYKLKASLYDLLFNSVEEIDQSQRILAECIIILEEEMINPTISFDINFPNSDEQLKDKLQPFFNTEEEMNKQILSLIVLGKFYTPEYLRGTYDAQNTNMIGTTASEVFSNQLSNWLSQISNNIDFGFNYRPGNQITDDEIEVALSTQIFNDRVTLNGNIGNNTNQYSENSSQIVGDFEMSVKLVPSGKIQFKAYNRSNNNLIYETAPYTQGIGLSFKEEYNSIDELFKKLTGIFKKKKE